MLRERRIISGWLLFLVFPLPPATDPTKRLCKVFERRKAHVGTTLPCCRLWMGCFPASPTSRKRPQMRLVHCSTVVHGVQLCRRSSHLEECFEMAPPLRDSVCCCGRRSMTSRPGVTSGQGLQTLVSTLPAPVVPTTSWTPCIWQGRGNYFISRCVPAAWHNRCANWPWTTALSVRGRQVFNC